MPTRAAVGPLLARHLTKLVSVLTDTYPEIGPTIFNRQGTQNLVEMVQNFVGYGPAQPRTPGTGFAFGEITLGFSHATWQQPYGLADMIAKEYMDKDPTGMLSSWVGSTGGAMAEAAHLTRELVPATWFNTYGFVSTTGLKNMADGVALVSSAHPASPANRVTTQSNRAPVRMNFDYAALEWANTNLGMQQAANGLYIDNKVQSVVLHPEKLTDALQLLKTTEVPDTTDHGINIFYGKFRPISWPYWKVKAATTSASTNGWLAIGEKNWLNWYDGQSEEFEHEYIAAIRSHLYTLSFMFGFGADDWRGTAGDIGAT